MTIGPLERLSALLAVALEAPAVRAIAARPIALGWATVDLERAAVELGAELGIADGRFRGAADTTVLGARCRVARRVLPEDRSLVLLEPATEGRLAATLARSGEGPAAVWLAVTDLAAAIASLRVAGVEASVARAGPFGAERLVLDGPIHGPHRLVIELAGTIRA